MTTSIEGPYAPPKAELDKPVVEDTSAASILTARGRFGTIRYLAYLASVGIVGNFLFEIIGFGLAELPPKLAVILYSVASIGFILCYLVLFVIWTIKRLHDIDRSGWYALLIPLAPILLPILCFIPGTRGANQYGPVPSPNTIAEKILGTIYLIGVVLAFAWMVFVALILMAELIAGKS